MCPDNHLSPDVRKTNTTSYMGGADDIFFYRNIHNVLTFIWICKYYAKTDSPFPIIYLDNATKIPHKSYGVFDLLSELTEK